MTQETKKMITGLVAISILTGGILYEDKAKKQEIKIDESLKEVTNVFEDDTRLDEAEELNIATYNGMTITEAADYLEDSIDIVEMLSVYDFSEVENLEKLTAEEYAFAESLTKEDVIILTTVLDIKDDSDSLEYEENRIKTIKMLAHIKETREKWMNKHSKNVVLDMLDWTIKGSIADDLDISPEDLNKIEIPPIKKVTDMNFYVIYDDNKYYVGGKSNLFSAFYYRYQIKSTNDFQGQEYNIYKDALNSAKIAIMSGVNTENYKFNNERSFKDAKKVLKRD